MVGEIPHTETGQVLGHVKIPESGVVAGPCGTRIEFRREDNGTFMIYVSGTTDKPLDAFGYCEILGFLEGHMGPMVDVMDLRVVELGASTDIGEWKLDGISSISLHPRQWKDVILRIYQHGKRLRVEGHVKCNVKIREAASLLIMMVSGMAEAGQLEGQTDKGRCSP
jgi:hypothetical protein